MGEGGRDEKVTSSLKKKRIEGQSAKINTLFMTKMAANGYNGYPIYDQNG